MSRPLVTGFEPFGDIASNPSQSLAERLAHEYNTLVLPVAYVSALKAIEEAREHPWVLALGVHGRDGQIWLEKSAHRRVGSTPDVHGVKGSAEDLPPGPEAIHSTIFTDRFVSDLGGVRASDDAGDYLCNFWYYCLLSSGIHAAFAHVPRVELMDLDSQEAVIRHILLMGEAMF